MTDAPQKCNMNMCLPEVNEYADPPWSLLPRMHNKSVFKMYVQQ